MLCEEGGVETSSGRTGSAGPATGTEWKWGHLPRSLSPSRSFSRTLLAEAQENEGHKGDPEMRR